MLTKLFSLCSWGFHDYKKIGPVKPIRSTNDFSVQYEGHYALGKCVKCAKKSFIHCYSVGAHCPTMTEAEYLQCMEDGFLTSSNFVPPKSGTSLSTNVT